MNYSRVPMTMESQITVTTSITKLINKKLSMLLLFLLIQLHKMLLLHLAQKFMKTF